MKHLKLFFNLLCIALMANVISLVIPQSSPLAIFGVLVLGGIVCHFIAKKNPGLAFDTLAQEVWIPLVQEDPYPKALFVNAAQDMSPLVDNNKINFAEAGADPIVLVDNVTYPINVAVATDLPKSVELKTYDTESTVVRNAVAIELAYDQRVLYANKHKKAMAKKIGLDAAYAFAPTVNDATKKNTVLNLAAGDSVIDAIIDMQKAYNEFDDDGTDRHIVLCPAHLAKISKEDKALYKAMMADIGGIFFGFKTWMYSQNPIYIISTLTKAAQGAAFVTGTHKVGSFVFLGNETMRAEGTMEMFSQLKDPANKGDIFNFQKRALVMPLRDKYKGAIITP
jgi:hypothetical protein